MSEPQSTSSTVSTGLNKALIWSYFTRVDQHEGQCKKCNKKIKTPTSSTSSLIRHLNIHPKLASEYKVESDKLKQARCISGQSDLTPTGPKQQKLSTSFLHGKQWASDHPKAKSLTKKIAVWMAKSCHPYSIAEEEGFIDLMKETVPLYKVPTRTTFSRSIIPSLYSLTKSQIYETIQKSITGIQSVSYTTDLWTSNAGGAFISLTMHFMDSNFNIKRFSLGTSSFAGEHTGNLIREKINSTLREWKLTSDDLAQYDIKQFIVTDNARNMVSAFDEGSTDMTRISCFAHTLQLCIADVKQEVRGMQMLISKARAIVGHYKHSPKASNRLEELQKAMDIPTHKLIQDIDTRWNSEFLMLQRLIEQKCAISAELAASGSNVANLSQDEWITAESYVEILQPLHHATNSISEDAYPTLSLKSPIIYGMLKMLMKKINSKCPGVSLARSLHKATMTRFPLYKQDKLSILSMILDPRFKHTLLEPHEKELAKSWLIESISILDIQTKNPNQNSSQPQPVPMKSDSLFEDIDNTTNNSQVMDEDVVHKQVTSYLDSRLLPRNENPCLWWQNNQIEFSSLLPSVKRFLPIPATSVASERLFSAAGNVVTNRRFNLITEHVEQLVFLHENL